MTVRASRAAAWSKMGQHAQNYKLFKKQHLEFDEEVREAEARRMAATPRRAESKS
jgi:hypothetical protein